jgi:histidine phosphotransferase ChpT
MPDNKPDIAALVSSRICHDLISPIGAISNGLELLELSGTAHSPELTLIAQSVQSANAKIRFLRIAFGDALGGTITGPGKISDILDGYYNDPRTELLWMPETPLDRSTLQLLFLLLLCLEKTIPYGGRIEVAQTNTGFQLTTKGDIQNAEGFFDFKTQRLYPQNGPPFVQYTLAQTLLDQMQYSMKLSHTDGVLDISLSC